MPSSLTGSGRRVQYPMRRAWTPLGTRRGRVFASGPGLRVRSAAATNCPRAWPGTMSSECNVPVVCSEHPRLGPHAVSGGGARPELQRTSDAAGTGGLSHTSGRLCPLVFSFPFCMFVCLNLTAVSWSRDPTSPLAAVTPSPLRAVGGGLRLSLLVVRLSFGEQQVGGCEMSSHLSAPCLSQA